MKVKFYEMKLYKNPQLRENKTFDKFCTSSHICHVAQFWRMCASRANVIYSRRVYKTSGMQKISVCQYCIYSGMNPEEHRGADL